MLIRAGHGSVDNNGGDDGNRTHDIYLAKVALCQLTSVPQSGTFVSKAFTLAELREATTT